MILADACRWYALRVDPLICVDGPSQRTCNVGQVANLPGIVGQVANLPEMRQARSEPETRQIGNLLHDDRAPAPCPAVATVSPLREEIAMEVVHSGRLRDFFGLSRAKHAVVEAAILATRISLVPIAEIRCELDRLAVLVEKTGGTGERRAFRFLQQYIVSGGEVPCDERPLRRGPKGTGTSFGLGVCARCDNKTGREMNQSAAASERLPSGWTDAPSPALPGIRVIAPSRLHFGMLRVHRTGNRHYGGAGAMIASPGIELLIRPASRWETVGPVADRAWRRARGSGRARQRRFRRSGRNFSLPNRDSPVAARARGAGNRDPTVVGDCRRPECPLGPRALGRPRIGRVLGSG